MNSIRRTGFSLIELMMAIGILAIGAALVATAFPVAMLENKKSVEHTMGAIISENALAICRIKLRHSRLKISMDGTLRNITNHMTRAETSYPMARPKDQHPEDWVTVGGTDYPSARYGWMVAARSTRAGANEYELSIVVYEKFLPTDRPSHEIRLDPSCKTANYAPDGETVDPDARDPTVACWVVRTCLRP